MTDVGEYTFDSNVILTDGVRGVDYITTFDVYSDGRAAGTCGALVVGDPWVATAWPTIRASGKAGGTEAFIAISAGWLGIGDVSTPARFALTVRALAHEVVFADGADGSMQITVEIVNGSGAIEDWLMLGELYIANSALRPS